MRPAALIVLLSVAACDIPPDRDPGSGPVVLATDPADEQTGVDRADGFLVFFDRYVSPRDVHRGRVRVQSGSRAAFVSPWFEPVERALRVELIGVPLEPSVRYRLWVEGIRDLDGVRMREAHEVTFETGFAAEGRPEPPAVPFERVRPIFAGCASDGCHGAERPALGLDLSSGEAIARSAVGVVAEETRVGTQAEAPWHGAPTLDGLAIIDVVGGVGRPARSYLMYKVLGDPHAGGDPMPPAARLGAAELSALSWWIRGGAPTE